MDWSPGDEVALAPTDYYQVAETQRLTLSAVNSTSLTTQQAVSAPRWGLLQYASAGGVSLDPTTELTPTGDLVGTPTRLDERAEIGNLTRNIVIQAPDDSLWQAKASGPTS